MATGDKFQPGFFGASGYGPGKHSNTANDALDAAWANNLERQIVNLYNIVQSEGHYSNYRMETVSGTYTEYFSGDATTTSFQLQRSIHKFDILGYDLNVDDPYASGIEPRNLGGQLTTFNTGTKMSETLYFTTAPPSGVNNVKITYYTYTKLPSQLDGGAFFNDWLEG